MSVPDERELKSGVDDWKRLPEVQQSMKQTIINKKDQWMTPELINQLQSNPELLKLFTNPEYMQVTSPVMRVRDSWHFV